MNFQHGEVFVTEDGATTDLIGHYERFTGVNLRKDSTLLQEVFTEK